jgi:hypothetical protein
MQDRTDEPQLREARILIDNIRHGAAVEASRERLLDMIAELIQARELGHPLQPAPASYQKGLG